MKGLVHNQFIWKLGKLREMDEYQNSLLLLLEFILDYPVYSRPEIPKKYLAWKKPCSLNNLRNPGYTGNNFARGYCACALHDGEKTWRTKKMTTPLLRRFVYLTIVKILAQFKETVLFIKHISCSPSQVDVYLAQTLANNLFLFQVRSAEFFPKLTTCGN